MLLIAFTAFEGGELENNVGISIEVTLSASALNTLAPPTATSCYHKVVDFF